MNKEEQTARAELMSMSKEQLALVDHDVLRWVCQGVDCAGYTKIKDYGISPWYWTRWGWLNLEHHYLHCARCWKAEKRGVDVPHKETSPIQNLIFDKKQR